MSKSLLVFIPIVIGSGSLAAQLLDYEAEVVRMFDQEVNPEDILYYEGMLDESYDVRWACAEKNGSIKGIYQLVSSDVSFEVEGQRDSSGALFFIELDPQHHATAYITGELVSSGKAKLEWSDIYKLHHIPLELEKVNSFSNFKKVKKRVYLTRSELEGRQELEIIKRKESNEIIIVDLYANKEYKIDYICKTEACDEWAFKNENARLISVPIKFLHFQEKKDQYRIVTDKGLTQYYTEKVNDTIFDGRMDYADSRSMYDLHFPILEEDSFDSWIKTLMDDRVLSLNQELKKLTGQVSLEPAEERFHNEAYSWYTIDYWSENIISGTITFTKSWTGKTEKISFIFDIKKGKEITQVELFKKEFESKEFFSHQWQSQADQINQSGTKTEKNWLVKNQNKHISISREGLICYSDYNVIYGDRKLIIPLEEISPFIRNKTIIKELLK